MIQMILRKDRRKRKYFEKRVLGHLDSLYFGALKLTGHREDAEDLVQETCHRAFNHMHQLKDLEKTRPWLYRIMINTWKNWRAKRSVEFSYSNPKPWEEPMPQEANGNPSANRMNPEEDFINKELWRAVESALTHLPSNYRMAVILSDIEGMSYREISEIMEWPIGTVMSRLSRARNLLTRFLNGYKDEL